MNKVELQYNVRLANQVAQKYQTPADSLLLEIALLPLLAIFVVLACAL